MSAEQVVELLTDLAGHGVDACVGGGWAVDALLGEQTRPHGDLDLWVPAAQMNGVLMSFVPRGLNRLQPWGDARPWNMTVADDDGLRVDLHLYESCGEGTWHYGSVVSGKVFPDEALQGSGTIDGVGFRCDAPEWSVQWHTGYPPRDIDRHDVVALCKRFELVIPADYR